MSSLATAIVGGILAILIVGGAVIESVTKGVVDPTLVVMATAVVATFFTGQAVRQVNGNKVDALTTAVLGIHTRLDQAKVSPAADGTAAAAAVGAAAPGATTGVTQ